MQLSTRQKRLLRWLGYPLLALVTFIITLHLTFPYGALKHKIEDSLSDKYEVSIYKVERTTLPGGIILKTVRLKSRPTKPKDEPVTLLIDELRLDIGLFGLLRGRYDIDVEAKIAGGSINGNVLVTKAGINAKMKTSGLPLANIPGLRSAVGLPMDGGLNADLAINLPKRRWREVDGHIKLSCPSCTIGDGEAKIKPKPLANKAGRGRSRNRAFSGEGVTVPRLNLGDLSGEIEIKKGVGTVKHFAGKSDHGEITIEGDLRFKDPFKNSTFPGCMRFKLSDELANSKDEVEKRFSALPGLLKVNPDPDGFSNVAMTGTLGTLRWRPRRKCPTTSRDTGGETGRPTVTTRPPKPPKAGKGAKVKPNRGAATMKPPEVTGPNNSGPKLTKEGNGGKKPKRGDDVKAGAKNGRRIKTTDDVGKPEDSGTEEGDDDDDDDDDDDEPGDDDDDDDDRAQDDDDDDDDDDRRDDEEEE